MLSDRIWRDGLVQSGSPGSCGRFERWTRSNEAVKPVRKKPKKCVSLESRVASPHLAHLRSIRTPTWRNVESRRFAIKSFEAERSELIRGDERSE